MAFFSGFDNFSANYIFNNFKPISVHETKNIARKSTHTPNLENGFTWNWYAEYEIKSDDGEVVESFTDYMVLRGFTEDEIELLLTLSGFKDIHYPRDGDYPMSLLSVGVKPE